MLGSEIARLKQQIADEYIAATRGLEGYSLVAKHLFITQRMDAMGQHSEALKALVGEEETGRIIIEVLEMT